MKSKLFILPNAGDVLISKHPKSKKLSIKLKANAIPRVVIPTLMTYEMGFRFAVEKENWIIETSEKLKGVQKVSVITDKFDTRFHTINIKSHSKNVFAYKKEKTDINLFFPQEVNVEEVANQVKIKNFIVNVLRGEAKKYLPARTQFLADKYGFTFNKIFIKNQKTRWGSCSWQNNINLNLHLMRLPEHLSDFIILHELCHTIHKNHGAQFYELLNRLVGNEKLLNKELRTYTIHI